MNLSAMEAEYQRLSDLLSKGLTELRNQAQAWAQAEKTYREAKSVAWAKVPKTVVPERQATVDAMTAELRFARDLAEGMKQAALESVRSRRTQISALQTLLNAEQEEMKFSRTGPTAA